ncbi:MAG: ACT domain-containing protein [Halanaerobiales bacterium]
MEIQELSLRVMKYKLAVSKIDSTMPIPLWVLKSREFYSITRTKEEMSIISSEESVPPGVKTEKGWKAIKVEGNLDFSMVGVISSISKILGDAGISIFVMSTYNTDYILIKEEKLASAENVLKESFELKLSV